MECSLLYELVCFLNLTLQSSFEGTIQTVGHIELLNHRRVYKDTISGFLKYSRHNSDILLDPTTDSKSLHSRQVRPLLSLRQEGT